MPYPGQGRYGGGGAWYALAEGLGNWSQRMTEEEEKKRLMEERRLAQERQDALLGRQLGSVLEIPEGRDPSNYQTMPGIEGYIPSQAEADELRYQRDLERQQAEWASQLEGMDPLAPRGEQLRGLYAQGGPELMRAGETILGPEVRPTKTFYQQGGFESPEAMYEHEERMAGIRADSRQGPVDVLPSVQDLGRAHDMALNEVKIIEAERNRYREQANAAAGEESPEYLAGLANIEHRLAAARERASGIASNAGEMVNPPPISRPQNWHPEESGRMPTGGGMADPKDITDNELTELSKQLISHYMEIEPGLSYVQAGRKAIAELKRRGYDVR